MDELLPEPLLPPDVDCTDLDGFMLNVERLMASELVALATHEEFAAAIFLWCRAWKQTPAASLPDDDRINAAFARLSLARFKKLKERVLHGFVKCSDGRLYHRFLAAEAVKAYERKSAFKKRRDTDAERLRKWRDGQRGNATETRDETQGETRFVAEGQGQGQGQGQLKKEDDVEARAPGHDRGDEPQPEPVDPATLLIAEFDDARASAFGEPRRRPWPSAQDLPVARRWLDAGADATLCRAVFDASMQRSAAANATPPETLKYFDAAVANAIAAAKNPMPEGRAVVSGAAGRKPVRRIV